MNYFKFSRYFVFAIVVAASVGHADSAPPIRYVSHSLTSHCELLVKKDGSAVFYNAGSSGVETWFEGPWPATEGRLYLPVGHYATGEIGNQFVKDEELAIDFEKDKEGNLQPKGYTLTDLKPPKNKLILPVRTCSGLSL